MATVYFLMQSLACDLPFEASREFLIDYFEEIRFKFIKARNSKTLLRNGQVQQR